MAYKTGAISLGKDTRLDIDNLAFARIARQFNPGVEKSGWESRENR